MDGHQERRNQGKAHPKYRSLQQSRAPSLMEEYWMKTVSSGPKKAEEYAELKSTALGYQELKNSTELKRQIPE
jgi:hypothetical protein